MKTAQTVLFTRAERELLETAALGVAAVYREDDPDEVALRRFRAVARSGNEPVTWERLNEARQIAQEALHRLKEQSSLRYWFDLLPNPMDASDVERNMAHTLAEARSQMALNLDPALTLLVEAQGQATPREKVLID